MGREFHPSDETASFAANQSDLIEAALHQAQGVQGRPAPAASLPEHIASYRIIRRLGGGGMGVVYEAEQAEPHRRVALKVIRAPSAVDSYHLRLFEREIEALARLQHPSIARIYDAGHTDDGHPYFVMERVDGLPIVEYCQTHELSLRDRLSLFVRVCQAVHHAHQRQVIHRDLKPANILVDDEGVPHVLDFGLARFTEPDMDVTRSMLAGHALVGTLPYMSPEQTRGASADLDIRTDVYSLGVLLYEMLTGHYPYPVTGQLAEVFKNITEAAPARPSTLQRGINDEVETIVLRALAKERDRRYASAAALAEDIANYLDGRPINAKRDSAWYVLRKLAFRHRYATATAALVAILVIAFSAISFHFYLGERQARSYADERTEQLRAELQEKSELARAATVAQQATARLARQAHLHAFLLAWHQGRAAEVNELRDRIPENTREGLALRFLATDESQAIWRDELRRRLDDTPSYFRDFVLGERHLRSGNAREARGAYEQARQALHRPAATQPSIRAGESWLRRRLAARLSALGSGASSEDTTSEVEIAP